MKDKSLRGVSILAVLFVAIYNIKYTSKASSSVLTLATEYNSGTVLKEKDAQIHSLQKVITEYQSSMTASIEEFQSSMTALKEELVELKKEKVSVEESPTLENLQSSMTALKEELVELKKEKVPVKDAPTLENQTGQHDAISSKEEPTRPQANKFPILPESRFMTALDSPRKSNETFSACLVWNDDLPRLPEWIAYHYQVLPLTHLVFFRDPKSTMDPLPILDRFKDLIKITYWSKLSDVMNPFPGAKEEFETLARSKAKFKVWRRLQVMFYRHCSHYLKSLGATWVYLADTDEFAALNNLAVPDSYNKMKKHGIILDTIKMAYENEKLLANKFQKRRWSAGIESDCKVMARYRWSSFESPKEEVTKHVPPNFDPYRFITLRFFHYRREVGLGKCIGDVSKLKLSKVSTDYHAHRLLPICGDKKGREDDIVTVHHYIGSWEYYQRPGDTRGRNARDRDKFDSQVQEYANRTISANGHIRLWLQGLVDYIGEEKAMFLLQDTGFPYNESTALPIVEVDHTKIVTPK